MSLSKKEILKLLQSGKISEEEALNLLNEVESEVVDEEVLEKTRIVNKKPKYLVIKARTNSNNTNVRIPLVLIKLAKKFDLKTEGLGDIDYDSLIKFIEEEGSGKFLDVHGDDNDVEIYVE